jgi:hypothetical protein
MRDCSFQVSGSITLMDASREFSTKMGVGPCTARAACAGLTARQAAQALHRHSAAGVTAGTAATAVRLPWQT